MALKGIKAGTLDRKIDILSPLSSQDESGQPIYTYALYHACAAAVEEPNAKEVFEADMLSLPFFKYFILRFKKGVNELMKIQYNGEFYDIHSVAEVGRRQGQRILAERITKPEVLEVLFRLYEDGRIRQLEVGTNRVLES
jgi:SPP1 family predicted phage head-tail adaptor